MANTLKETREQFKKQGKFHTPLEVATRVKEKYLKEKPHPKNVYDPTLGAGTLLKVFDDSIPKYGQEIDEEAFNQAKEELVNFTGVLGDTLKEPAFKGMKFDVIYANPPFSIKWEEKMDWRFEKCGILAPASKADWAFNLHIVEYLADDGIALAINFPGILYRGNREQKIREWLIEQNYIDKIIQFPANELTDTNISTVGIVFKKNKTTTDVEFIDEENDISRIVKKEEIKQNNYNLSTSTYVQKEEEKEVIDPIKLDQEVLDITYKNIERRVLSDRAIRTELAMLFTPEQNKIRVESFNSYLRNIINLCKRNIFTQEERTKIISGKVERKLEPTELMKLMDLSIRGSIG